MLPRLLAFDTSTEWLAVALHDGLREHRCVEAGGVLASSRLVPAIDDMLARAGLSYRELDAIAFGRGPGAFTGLRTSCAVAQGLAFGVAKPVLAVDSLLIVAEDARVQLAAVPTLEVVVVMDARMDEIYAGCYRFVAGRWHEDKVPGLFTPQALALELQGKTPTAVAGSALRAFGERLQLPPAVRVQDEHDRAAALLRLAGQLWAQGAAVPAAQALPVYLRDKVAFTTAEREASRSRT